MEEIAKKITGDQYTSNEGLDAAQLSTRCNLIEISTDLRFLNHEKQYFCNCVSTNNNLYNLSAVRDK